MLWFARLVAKAGATVTSKARDNAKPVKASFITYPATQTHMDIPEEIRIANGVCNRLLRFSVGIEHAEDLKEDLKQALCQVKEGAVSFE